MKPQTATRHDQQVAQLSDEQKQFMLQCLITEQSALQTARSATVFESNGRVTLYLSSVSSALVALAFIGQASDFGSIFFLFSLILLPTLLAIGAVTMVRVLQSAIEDTLYARNMNRIRHFYVELASPIKDYLLLSTHDDEKGVMQNMGIRPGGWQILFTTASMVAVVNGVLTGVFVGLAARQFGVQSLIVASVVGISAFTLTLYGQYRYQVRAWQRAIEDLTVRFPSPQREQ